MKTLKLAEVIVCASVLPRGAGAHTLTAPASVQAAGDGSFSCQATFTAGPGSFVVAHFGWNSSQTSPTGMVADCSCGPACTKAEGATIPMFVEGRLTNPTQAATVTAQVTDCSSAQLTANTTVLPVAQVVPALPAWVAGLMALGLAIIGLRAWSSKRRPV